MTDPGAPRHAGEPSYPQYPAYPGDIYRGYPEPVEPTRSLSGLGIATQVLLVVQLVAAIGLLFPVFHERDLIRRARSGPGSVTLHEAQRADDTLAAMSGVVGLLYIATGIVWIIWFHRARKNVEAWGPIFQRLRPGWAIGGWICPIVNLWFPYMIARDILDDTERAPDDRTAQRHHRPLLVVWWLSFVTLFVFDFIERFSKADTLDELARFTDIEIAAIIARVVGVIPALAVIHRITAAQTQRIKSATTALS